MKVTTTSTQGIRSARPSFTLIELLVVLAIISIITALSIATILKTIGVQQANNAKTEIRRVDAVLSQRWKAAIDNAYATSSSISVQFGPQAQSDILTMAGGDTKRARTIYISYYLKQQFPQSFAEVLLCTTNAKSATPQYYNPLGPDPAYVRKLTTTYGITPAFVQSQPTAQGESSALLVMALEKSINGPGNPGDVFGAATVKNLPFTIVGGGSIDIPVFKDDWGTPLQFYRWSTANADLQAVLPATGTSTLRNPLDPDNTLINKNWWNGTYKGYDPVLNRALFEASCYSLSSQPPPLGPPTPVPVVYYITPVVVSAGQDTNLGLDMQTMAVTVSTAANDNLYSYQIKRE